MLASAKIDRSNAELPPVPGIDPGEKDLTLDELIERRLARAETLEDVARVLYWLLEGGYSVWTDGKLLYARALVGRIGRLRIEIRPREHAPPHFHVTALGIDASFAIADCSLLKGAIDGRDRALVEYWHRNARPRLIEVWNATRPSDCPVGPIVV